MVALSPSLATLERLAAIAAAAGEAILAHYGEEVEVERKSDLSPITAADRAAHDLLLAALGALDPTVPILSEEGRIPDYAERREWERFWLVDPLDGTKEFLSRNGEFTVNIALVERGEPTLGVVHAPALDVLYSAGKGLGTWKRTGDARPVRVFSARKPRGSPLTVVESRSHPSPELERFLAGLPVERRVAAGSSLKFGLLAEGAADLYPRFGPTMEWDVGAGDCLWRQSGRDGERRSPLAYNKPSLRNDSFVIGLENGAPGAP